MRQKAKCTKTKSQTVPGQAYKLKDLVEKLQGGAAISRTLYREGEYTMDQMANDANSVDISQAMEKYNRVQQEIEALDKSKKAQAKQKELEQLKEQLRAEIEAESAEQSESAKGEDQ